METNILTFTCEPSGPLYRRLLEVCVDHCKSGLVVERPWIGMSERGRGVIEHLRPWIRDECQLSEWPGTKLHGHTALVRSFAFDRESASVLARSANSLYEWQQPALPEDLCLLRPDGEPWLVSIAHERDGYLVVSAEERDEIVRLAPELAVLLGWT